MTLQRDQREPVFARLEAHGLITVRGPDSTAFLQGQLTCDVSALAAGRFQHGGYCTAKGRLLATFLMWRHEDGYRLLVPGGQCAVMQKQLAKFVLRSRVEVMDASADYVYLGLWGDGAPEAARLVLGHVPAAAYGISHDSTASVLALPADRYAVVVPAVRAQAITNSLGRCASRVAVSAWNWQEIHAGIPEIGPDTQEAFVPQMVNLDLLGGVSFSKGCYTGQEIVARMHYLGRLKQRMYLVRIDDADAPQAGNSLYGARFGDQACGTIVRAAPDPGGGYDALAVVQIEEAQSGTVRWRAADGPPVVFLQLPYSLAAP